MQILGPCILPNSNSINQGGAGNLHFCQITGDSEALEPQVEKHCLGGWSPLYDFSQESSILD